MKKLFFIFVLPLSLLAQKDFKIEPLDGYVNTFGAELNFIQINDTLAFYTSFQDEGSYQSSIYFTTKRNKKWGKGKYSKYNSELFDTGDISFLNDDIISFVARSNRFVPHFHIPLQSGSDRILKSMRRRYLTSLYTQRIAAIKELMPYACVGVDVIVGYPGETEEDFLTSYRFLADLEISYLHVFTYSERPNTEALTIEEVIPQAIRNKRSKMLRALSVKKRRAFYESQLGKSYTVLFEGENKKGYCTGFTENYVKVRTPWNPKLVNSLQEVVLESIDSEGYVRFETKA